MKYFLQIFLSFFLTITIVAPSIISLIDENETMELVLEQNEDENQKENKEGEKGNNDKDTYYHNWHESISACLKEQKGNITHYLEGYNNPSLNIFLPPPELV